MAYVRNSFHGGRNITIQMPARATPQNQIVQFRAKTSEFFNDLNSNIRFKELINLINTHFILQEYWLFGYKWEEKRIITNIKYRLNFGEIPKERGEFILILLKIDGEVNNEKSN